VKIPIVECHRFSTACAGTELNFRTRTATCKIKYVSVHKRWMWIILDSSDRVYY